MSTRMTINGVSTCTEAGTEKYEKFQTVVITSPQIKKGEEIHLTIKHIRETYN